MAWEFFVAYALGAAYAIWLVWPWLLGMAITGRRLHWQTWVFNVIYSPIYLTVAAMVLYPVALLLGPRLPINLLGLNFEHLGPLALSGLVFVYLILFDFFYYWFHRAQHR
ncbi:MAG: hypothetical protein H7293_11100 [Candidatus Saccharibacteria bacterium]|nr:hypothetical protein [Rhodoferax sp.]